MEREEGGKEGHITAPRAVRTPTHSIQVSTIKILENRNSEMAETGGNKPKWQKQVEMTGARLFMEQKLAG